jgi:predicted amidohydrolase YtcJ
LADLLIRAGRIYSMAEDRSVYRAIALRDEWIVAVSADPRGLDALISAETQVLDEPSLTILSAFYDTHNHLREAWHNADLVPVERAHSLADLIELIHQEAAVTPTGAWIRTSNAWNENNLNEKRLPTALELDAATSEHPVLVRRGGHLAVVNSRALQLAGITSATPNPVGGTIGRLSDGSPNGVLEGAAASSIAQLIPAPSLDQEVASLVKAGQMYAAVGLGTIRDPLLMRDDLLIYQAAWERGLLPLRCRLMPLIPPSGSLADRIAQIEGYGMRSGFGDDWLRLRGIKLVMDGGAEGAALAAPYANDPSYSGHLNWDPDDMVAVATAAVRRGWRIGTHAVGDRAVRTLLDVYERVAEAHPGLPPGTFALEHGFLVDATQRERAIHLGVAITIQHPLLYSLGEQLMLLWGSERTRQVFPIKAWLAEGGDLSAGTDYPVGAYNPIESIWGVVTRATKRVGVQGPENAIDQYTAIRRYTTAGAHLDREGQRRGTFEPGRLADLVGFADDPISCPIEQLRALRPVFTVIGGRSTHDPGKLLP